jgi:hypothetical protein
MNTFQTTVEAGGNRVNVRMFCELEQDRLGLSNRDVRVMGVPGGPVGCH